MKIIAFGASHNKASINKVFATYAANQFEAAEIEILDLNDFDLPIYTVDKELAIGHPQAAHDFVDKLNTSDLIIISLSEHNGSYTAGFKNIFDWASRVKLKLFENKKLLLLSTTTGPGAGKYVMENAKLRFPRHGGDIIGTFSLPRFNDNFSQTQGILSEQLREEFAQLIRHAQHVLLTSGIEATK